MRISPRDIAQPNRILEKLISSYINGDLEDYTVFYVAAVIDIDTKGGAFKDEPLPNPRNSIRARVITDSMDKYTSEEDLPVFWPMFPYDRMPIKKGEHAWVVFSDPEQTHGLWLTRIAEPHGIHDTNYTPGKKRFFENKDNDFNDIGIEQAIQDTEVQPLVVKPSDEFVVEEVPEFQNREGDRVLEGSNNSVIVLGRDRPSTVESGEKKESGTIDLVVGRKDKDDLNMLEDKSRVYISMNTDVDKHFETEEVGPASPPSPTVGLKSDQVRIVGREGMKLFVKDGDIFIEGANIHFGSDTNGESGVLGDTLVDTLGDLISAIKKISLNTAVGPTAPVLINQAEFVAIEKKLQDILSKTIKLKK